MVGSSLAAGLAQNPAFSNRKVVLLEAAPEKPYQPLPPGSFTNRVSALNPHTAKFLDGLGAWNPHIAQKSHSFRRMYVWEECSPASIEFSEEEAMGHMVENDVTTAALTTVMKQQCHPDRLEVIYGARIEGVELGSCEGDNASVRLENGQRIEAGLLVGADGANSIVRRAMGGHYFAKDYHQMGVVATLTFDRPFENDTAYQKFMKEGPIAILPLSATKSSLVWTIPRSWAATLTKEWTPGEFAEKLNQSLARTSTSPLVDGANSLLTTLINSLQGGPTGQRGAGGNVRLPAVTGVENVGAFPLGTGLPQRSVASAGGAVLVGDAFHRSGH